MRSHHVNQNAKVNRQRRSYDSAFFQRMESLVDLKERTAAKQALQILNDPAREDTVYRVWVQIQLVGVVTTGTTMSRDTWHTYRSDLMRAGICPIEGMIKPRIKR